VAHTDRHAEQSFYPLLRMCTHGIISLILTAPEQGRSYLIVVPEPFSVP